ncbi:hypothetical protein NQ317_017504 [Molorchus minor]|uniref:Uncharacterized protein n=1 Tax=Molorchus minor TaxID=1323400 RepID=A0ABQ9JNP7_9CUCU|nr:hypothetical protein NQ317_017504 [Molorchus minor]
MPLLRSNLRLDPVLFKDPVSNKRKKYRRIELVGNLPDLAYYILVTEFPFKQTKCHTILFFFGRPVHTKMPYKCAIKCEHWWIRAILAKTVSLKDYIDGVMTKRRKRHSQHFTGELTPALRLMFLKSNLGLSTNYQYNNVSKAPFKLETLNTGSKKQEICRTNCPPLFTDKKFKMHFK